ncbi:MAG: hypothetical protein ACJ746_09400 [Bryobacteraceae bacterium]
MKKNLYVLALSALLGATAAMAGPQDSPAPVQQNQSAQSEGTHGKGHRQLDPQKQADRLAKRLRLTSEQQSQLLPILSQRADQAKALRSDTRLTATDRRAKLRDLRQESESQIRNILTDSQKQQYDALLQQARSHAGRKQQQASTPSAS